MEYVDLVIIGAGWFGLAAAKTYIELHPNDNVVIVEAAATAGGVWAEHRHYPGLKSNNMLGTYEYSDFPMDEATFGIKQGDHIPAAVLQQYLTSYAKHFGFFEHIRFNTKVQTVEGKDGGWILGLNTDDEKPRLMSKKLIVATGSTSEAHIPKIPGAEKFRAPIFHTRYFRDHENTLKTAKTVTVLGGAKSAFDAAYAYAMAGVNVNMIIRKAGNGPVWMSPAYFTPGKKWFEKLVHTRFLTWFSPCYWGAEDGYGRIRNFLHGTAVGRKVVNAFWWILGKDILDANGYDNHPEVKKLKPWTGAFWIGSGLSVLNYPTDFFDLVRNGTVKVHIADITELSEKTVHLSTGEALPADLLLCATGWKASPPIEFIGSVSNDTLGLPISTNKPDDMINKADIEILKRFPRLKDRPKLDVMKSKGKSQDQPFRLYRFMVPPTNDGERNVAFAGMVTTLTTPICAQMQALWISTYFDGKLDRWPTSTESMRWEASLHSQFGKWRYPCGYGAKLPDFVFDALPYGDMLLADMGMKRHRKASRIKEVFEPYGHEDFKGLVEEWKRDHKKQL